MAATVSVPGRIEVLGNHTDYNGGRVLIVPTRKMVTVRAQAVAGARVTVSSASFPESVSAPLDTIRPTSGVSAWANYVLGAVRFFRAQFPRRAGLRVEVSGDLPIGAGLASSAALCAATFRALGALERHRLAPAAIAAWSQLVENEFVGVPVGPLDPISCASGRRGWFTLLDFAGSPGTERVRTPRAWRLLVFDSGTRHALRAGQYAKRRRECAAAAKALHVAQLGELTPAQLAGRGRPLPATLRRRARHVVGESARVDAAAQILRGDVDPAELGALLNASQRSSRENFENSCPEIDALVVRLRKVRGVVGARLTGGGFGGAVIAWVRRDDVRRVCATIVSGDTGTPRLLDIV